MLPTTKNAVLAVCAADPSLTKETIDAALKVLSGATEFEPPAPIMRRREVARILGVSPKRINQLANEGALASVYAPNGSRRMGYTAASVKALAEGRATGNAGGEAAAKCRARLHAHWLATIGKGRATGTEGK